MKIFKWKCRQCNTINTDVGCSNCGDVPDFYIPIKGVELKPERIKPVKGGEPVRKTEPPLIPVEEKQQQSDGWVCENCGVYNGSKRTKCTSCNEPREEEKPKSQSVRTGLVVTVFLVCFAIIVIVVVGKLAAATNPGVLSGDFSAIFNPTRNSTDAVSSTDLPATETIEVNRVYPNPPVDGCKLWSDIMPDDAGKDVCVYGLVYTAYIGEPGQYNMRFSDDKESFRLVMTEVDELKLPEVLGECVYQTAEIKFYKDVPYMTFNSTVLELQYCEKPEE
jgi:hypothetical protein